MPLCLSKRHSAEELEVQSHDRAERMRVQADVGMAWVLSFLSTYRKKTYCLYEATPNGPAAPAEEDRHPLRQLEEWLLRDIGGSWEAAAR